MEAQSDSAVFVTDEQAAAINAARDALAVIRNRALYAYGSQASGMIYARADAADDALAAVLSTCRVWGEQELSDEQVYNVRDADAEPDAWPPSEPW